MYTYTGKVTNVVDGDTIDCWVEVAVNIGFGLDATVRATHRFRLLGVNCPEVHGPTRDAGLAAKAYTTAALLGKTVRLEAYEVEPDLAAEDRGFRTDSFARWLAAVYLGDVNFCKQLVEAGHAVPFHPRWLTLPVRPSFPPPDRSN